MSIASTPSRATELSQRDALFTRNHYLDPLRQTPRETLDFWLQRNFAARAARPCPRLSQERTLIASLPQATVSDPKDKSKLSLPFNRWVNLSVFQVEGVPLERDQPLLDSLRIWQACRLGGKLGAALKSFPKELVQLVNDYLMPHLERNAIALKNNSVLGKSEFFSAWMEVEYLSSPQEVEVQAENREALLHPHPFTLATVLRQKRPVSWWTRVFGSTPRHELCVGLDHIRTLVPTYQVRSILFSSKEEFFSQDELKWRLSLILTRWEKYRFLPSELTYIATILSHSDSSLLEPPPLSTLAFGAIHSLFVEDPSSPSLSKKEIDEIVQTCETVLSQPGISLIL